MRLSRHLLAIGLLPFVVTVVIPAYIIRASSISKRESALLGSLPLLAWSLVFFALNALTMPLIEEPLLESRFGGDYVTYKRNIPWWIPRLKPWVLGRAPPDGR